MVEVAKHAGARIAAKPDQDIIRQVFAASRGDEARIESVFKRLYQERRGPKRSWAFFVRVVRSDAEAA